MGTTQSFSNMLNQMLPMDLMRNELIKRDYLMQRVTHDESWKGGAIQVPFELQYGSSVEYGQLADVTDISQYKYSRGTISTQPEVWGSLILNHRDLISHDGKIPETTFLRILPNQVDAMLSYMKMLMSVQLLGSSQFATLTADGDSSGHITVDRVDRFTIDQKIVLNDNGTVGAGTYYVISININTNVVTVSATRGGSAADVHTYTVAHASVCQHPGQAANGMTSLASQLLPASNGGSTNLFGLAKTAAPFLQCPYFDGSGITSSNILSKLFDAYTFRQIKAKSGKLPEVLMSFANFGAILKQLELQKGAFNVVPNSRTATQFGWQTVSIGSVSGEILKIVAIQEMPDTLIYMLDFDSITFYSNGLIRRRKGPDGIDFYTARATTGFSYVVDHFCTGDLVVNAPWKQLIIGGVPSPLS